MKEQQVKHQSYVYTIADLEEQLKINEFGEIIGIKCDNKDELLHIDAIIPVINEVFPNICECCGVKVNNKTRFSHGCEE